MKKFILLLTIQFLLSSLLYSQTRTAGPTSFAGLGYSIMIFTDGDVSNTYPTFDFSRGDFLKQINIFYGMKFNDFSIEIAPAFIFTNTQSSDGFYYTETNGSRRFYYPQESRLFAAPINLKAKYYPFTSSVSAVSNIYFGAGAGMMYIKEEYRNLVYTDESRLVFLGTNNAKNSFWKPNFEAVIGIGSFSKFAYGFEVGYRFVPLDQKRDHPLITSLAGNFNSVNLSANVIFTF
jgi:hypothetical protein